MLCTLWTQTMKTSVRQRFVPGFIVNAGATLDPKRWPWYLLSMFYVLIWWKTSREIQKEIYSTWTDFCFLLYKMRSWISDVWGGSSPRGVQFHGVIYALMGRRTLLEKRTACILQWDNNATMLRGERGRGLGGWRSKILFFSLWDMAGPSVMEENLQKTSGRLSQGRRGQARWWYGLERAPAKEDC